MPSPVSLRLADRNVSWRRLLAAGCVVAAFVAAVGGAFELWRFGPTADSAAARVERQVRRDFDQMTDVLSRVADGVAADPDAARGLAAGADGARILFDVVDRRIAASGDEADAIAVTIYDSECPGAPPRCVARAWAGRPADIAPERVRGPASFFVTQSALGLRLVHIVPINSTVLAGTARAAEPSRRLGSVAVEHVLSPAPIVAVMNLTEFALPTRLGPVSLRMRWEAAGDSPRPNAFLLRPLGGEPLIEAAASTPEITQARGRLRRRVGALALAVLGLTVLLLIGPALDRRADARGGSDYVRLTAIALALLAAGGATFWGALALDARHQPRAPALLLLAGVGAAAAVGLLAGPAVRLRLAWRARRLDAEGSGLAFLAAQLVAGVVVAAVLVAFEWLLPRAADPATVDLRHFSLHPLAVSGDASRLALLVGLVASHVAALWTCTLVLVAAIARWRVPASDTALRVRLGILWIGPAAVVAALVYARGWPLPPVGILASAVSCALAALIAGRVIVWYRHTTVAARILTLFVAFLAPALLLYPSVDYFAAAAIRSIVATQYAVEAEQHSQTLQDRLTDARREIDALAGLPVLVMTEGVSTLDPAANPSAYTVWSGTALARARLTSAIELYNRDGTLVSRFALNLPEYSGIAQGPQTPQATSSCEWDVFGEGLPFGSEERQMLHAEKKICAALTPGGPTEPIGTIVVHVLVFDYRTLPFITSQNPYFEVFRPPDGGAPREGAAGGDVDVVIYGWSLSPVYMSGPAAWPITDELFSRLYDPARRSFWTTIRQGDSRYHVHFSNDRVFIYAIGYRTLTLFDHFVHLAELTTLAGTAYVLVLFATAFFTRLARARPRLGRALWREIRASFYRRLLLAFVLASIIPVLALAFWIRTYFANLLTADVAREAARTAAVAQRVIEQSNALLQRIEGLDPASDDVMVWISQVIDQDVNIFRDAQLIATSKRDLFASGLLATRTPDNVYRAIALQRLPGFVGEDRIGNVPYTIAAAPVQAGAGKVILTVPLATRQRDIEHEIDDLDRGVHLAALFFVLVGAAIGLSMAERIADPVRRLTRATRRIARGDFDAQIAVKSADELRRLVDAFNSMAAELKSQRTELERTHRLEAWAEMA
ncbi:MAG: HAMP domain-containing protein, partial [Acidobacteriota bacterium]